MFNYSLKLTPIEINYLISPTVLHIFSLEKVVLIFFVFAILCLSKVEVSKIEPQLGSAWLQKSQSE